MRTILCYGDSNTWGSDPAGIKRFDINSRWPGVLRKELGEGYHVIEEGLPGRTTVWEDPIEGFKSGKEYLIPCLDSHSPLDLVIIMLGTNDLKKRFSLNAVDVALGAGVLVDMVRKSGSGSNGAAPRVLLLAPPNIIETPGLLGEMFEGAEEKSKKFTQHFKSVAHEKGCEFLDASTIVVPSPMDGIHLEMDQHKKLGKAVADMVLRILV